MWAGSVVSNGGGWDVLKDDVDFFCLFVLLFSLKIPTFILFWFYFTPYCDLKSI